MTILFASKVTIQEIKEKGKTSKNEGGQQQLVLWISQTEQSTLSKVWCSLNCRVHWTAQIRKLLFPTCYFCSEPKSYSFMYSTTKKSWNSYGVSHKIIIHVFKQKTLFTALIQLQVSQMWYPDHKEPTLERAVERGNCYFCLFVFR